tara:strand:- start:239 stop:547 length:309 start_codon:yes stop_codon:yes gene_type:complete
MNLITDSSDPFSDKDTLDLAMYRFDISPVIMRFGDWVITDYGIECLSVPYRFTKNRVHEKDWIQHMEKKSWVNIIDFTAALVRSRFIWEKTCACQPETVACG